MIPRVAKAGMPSVGLSDFATAGLHAISFFLMGALLSALVVMLVWNRALRDFPAWPRLTFGRACGLVALWGLLFVLVLTMISGARELMTPGAWRKAGYTYELAGVPHANSDLASNEITATPARTAGDLLVERRSRLERLYAVLAVFATQNEGRFPESLEALNLRRELLLAPGPFEMKYIYVGGRGLSDASTTLVAEPPLFGSEYLVVRTDGTIHVEGFESTQASSLTAEAPGDAP